MQAGDGPCMRTAQQRSATFQQRIAAAAIPDKFDPYEILALETDATAAEIKKAYRKLSLQCAAPFGAPSRCRLLRAPLHSMRSRWPQPSSGCCCVRAVACELLRASCCLQSGGVRVAAVAVRGGSCPVGSRASAHVRCIGTGLA
jgi:hypothetical protein